MIPPKMPAKLNKKPKTEKVCVITIGLQYPIQIPTRLSPVDAKAELIKQLDDFLADTKINFAKLIVAKDDATGTFSLLEPEDVSNVS